MNDTSLYLVLADTVLVIHFLLVVFVVAGLLVILTGRLIGWTWIYSRAFRISHLLVIGIVAAQAWLGRLCPLTILENFFRVRAGETGYSSTFIESWLHRVLFYDADPWVFAVIYSAFGALVFVFWFIDRNRSRSE